MLITPVAKASTPLHLKQTKSSSFKIRTEIRSTTSAPVVPPAPQKNKKIADIYQTKNHTNNRSCSRVLQRQDAFNYQNSKESLNSEGSREEWIQKKQSTNGTTTTGSDTNETKMTGKGILDEFGSGKFINNQRGDPDGCDDDEEDYSSNNSGSKKISGSVNTAMKKSNANFSVDSTTKVNGHRKADWNVDLSSSSRRQDSCPVNKFAKSCHNRKQEGLFLKTKDVPAAGGDKAVKTNSGHYSPGSRTGGHKIKSVVPSPLVLLEAPLLTKKKKKNNNISLSATTMNNKLIKSDANSKSHDFHGKNLNGTTNKKSVSGIIALFNGHSKIKHEELNINNNNNNKFKNLEELKKIRAKKTKTETSIRVEAGVEKETKCHTPLVFGRTSSSSPRPGPVTTRPEVSPSEGVGPSSEACFKDRMGNGQSGCGGRLGGGASLMRSCFGSKVKDDTEGKGGKEVDVLEFIVPLEPHVEVVEGSMLELWVKVKGARRVTWVKSDKTIRNAPPDFVVNCNVLDGIFSLRIKDVFLQDSGVYICEAYGFRGEEGADKADLICWCNVEVIEDVGGEDEDEDTLEELIPELVPLPPQRRKLIVPLIITTPSSDVIMDGDDPLGHRHPIVPDELDGRRSFFANSSSSSQEFYGDALEDICEVGEEEGDDEVIASAPPEEEEARPCQAPSVENNQNVGVAVVVDMSGNEEVSIGGGAPITSSDNGAKFSPSKAESTTVETSISSPRETTDCRNSPDPSVVSGSRDEELNVHKETNSTGGLINSSLEDDSTTAMINQHESTFPEHDHEIPTRTNVSSLQSQYSTESEEVFPSSPLSSSLDEEDKEFDLSAASSVNSGAGGGAGSSGAYTGTFRDSLSDNPLAPKFLMGPSNLIVMLGETVHLRVKIWTPDDSMTDIGWCKLVRGVYQRLLDGTESHSTSESGKSSRIKITQPTNDLVMLTIPHVTYEDCGKYRVKISNANGADYHHCLVSVEGPPEPPSSAPTASYDPVLGQMEISWPCCPFDGGSAISGYILELKMKPSPISTCEQAEIWTVITTPSSKGLCYTLKNPKPGHTFYFRVCVENSHGKGKYSKTSDGVNVTEKAVQQQSNDVTSSSSAVVSSSAPRKISSSGKSSSFYDGDYEYHNVTLQHSDFLQYYEKHEQLGKGRFGVVFKVTNKSTGNSYAGKFVKCRKSSDKERAELEYKIMNDLKYHPKLICLVDCFEMPREMVFVTEMINGGELFERVVADDFTLTERDCVTFLRQICDGAKYIHEKNIMHLDLKPENILCTQKTSNQIKIIDFGLAQYYNPTEPIRVLFGTAEFVSPEIINYETICPATDMWSVGVITYILLSGLSPFLGDDDNETFSNITRGEFDFDDEAFEKVSDDAKDFISSVIVKRKEKRLTAEECLVHKWLALSESEKKDIVLSTDKLKRFLLRRKWQKTGNAIRALGRITTLYSSSRRSSSGTSSTTTTPTTSVSSPLAAASAGGRSESGEDHDSVFVATSDANLQNNHNVNRSTSCGDAVQKREEFAAKSTSGGGRYDESCRSDSGIGGDGPISGHFSLLE
ncbi:uncharacterized protein LOC110852983 isoform X2 [Folsomia candida]|uniref:uncharacterized protein LOC110852983 isoform X2 n=1 Tax=Folsomia candida TaxID=158441 RepID=UPI001604F5C6|nr:uncharacterized protein LOC110852983 isoform X2 [Folsomia candida]